MSSINLCYNFLLPIFKIGVIMAKLLVQNYAKLPNEYVSIERSRGLLELEEKLIYMLINAMQKRYEQSKKLDEIDYDYISSGQLNFQEFSETMHTTNNLKQIKESIKDLHTLSFAITVGKEIRFIHLFKEFRINTETNVIRYWFDDNFLQFFTGICRDYFSLDIQEVISLNSSHAIRVYQLLKSKFNMDKKEHVYTIMELKKILNIDKKYNQYNNFKQKVLEICKKQINESQSSKFSIDYEEIKTVKAVTSIKFIIKPKVKNYYLEKNLVAGYKIDLLQKNVSNWLNDKNSIVKLLAEKVQIELNCKKPNRSVIKNYVETITTITNQIKVIKLC